MNNGNKNTPIYDDEPSDYNGSNFNYGEVNSAEFSMDDMAHLQHLAHKFSLRESGASLMDGSGMGVGRDSIWLGQPGGPPVETPPTLARQETRAVHLLRAVTLLVIVAAAVAVAVFMYVYMSNDERDALDTNFYDLSHRLVQGFHANAQLRVQTMDLFATMITSSVLALNQTWPTVLIPDFEAKGAAARAIVSADYLGLYPHVTRDTRAEWEAFTVENTAFINASYAYQRAFKEHYGYDIGARAPEWRRQRERRQLQQQQQQQRRRQLRELPTTLNFDYLFENYTDDDAFTGNAEAEAEAELEEAQLELIMMDEDQVLPDDNITDASDNTNNDNDDDPLPPENTSNTTTTTTNATLGFRESVFDGPDGITTELYRYGTDEEGVLFVVDESDGPYFPMMQVSPSREFTAIDVNYNFNDPFYAPAFVQGLNLAYESGSAVFAGVWNVDDEGYIDENDDYDFRTVPALSLFYPVFDLIDDFNDREVVGILDLDIEFGPLASSVLPANSNELFLVIENPCNQVFTYRVTGQQAEYLGPEDLHNPKFNHMKTTALLTDFTEIQGGATYNGVPVHKDFCPWAITVYATQEMEDAYLTNLPLIYMFIILGIFLFTCFVFILYDRLVEWRQKKVLTTALNSEKIVNALFPEEFKNQLYENNKEDDDKRNSANSKKASRADAFTASSRESMRSSTNNDLAAQLLNAPPMAQLYPKCSVFFCDIAGFTSWSSSRSPADVSVWDSGGSSFLLVLGREADICIVSSQIVSPCLVR